MLAKVLVSVVSVMMVIAWVSLVLVMAVVLLKDCGIGRFCGFCSYGLKLRWSRCGADVGRDSGVSVGVGAGGNVGK